MLYEEPFESIYGEYVDALVVALNSAAAWEQDLLANEKYTDGRLDRAVIWLAGLAAHPLVIAVVREFYLRTAVELERRPDDLGATFVPDAEENWGRHWITEDKTPPSPRHLLFGRLAATHPEIAKAIQFFVYMPIGFDEHLMVQERARLGTA